LSFKLHHKIGKELFLKTSSLVATNLKSWKTLDFLKKITLYYQYYDVATLAIIHKRNLPNLEAIDY